MLPLILGVLGGYLIGDSIKDDAISMAKGGKLKAQLIHKENAVEYYKDGSLMNPTKEEKLNWSIFELPEGVERKEQSFETVIDEFEGKTKKEIEKKSNENIINGKYDYLPHSPDLTLVFNDKYADGGEVSKSWGVMYFKEGKNRFGEKIESAFNNTILKGTLKEAISQVQDELLGAITYATIKDRSIDAIVAKVKQDGGINIYREGYGFDKMAKGGITDDGGI